VDEEDPGTTVVDDVIWGSPLPESVPKQPKRLVARQLIVSHLKIDMKTSKWENPCVDMKMGANNTPPPYRTEIIAM